MKREAKGENKVKGETTWLLENIWNLIHTAGEVTEDNEKSLSSSWNFLDLLRLQAQLKEFYALKNPAKVTLHQLINEEYYT